MKARLLLVFGLAFCAFLLLVPGEGVSPGARMQIAKVMVSSGGTIATELELFRIHMGRYPNTVNELFERPADEKEAAKWKGPYLKPDGPHLKPSVLKDPWGEDVQYCFPARHEGKSEYDLWSKGPDKLDGTADDIGNWNTPTPGEGRDWAAILEIAVPTAILCLGLFLLFRQWRRLQKDRLAGV